MHYPLKAVISGLERHQLYIMGIAIAYLLPKPYEQISLFPFPLQHLSLGMVSAGSATSDPAPPCPLCFQCYGSRMDAVLVCPSSESLELLRLFPFSQESKFLSTASSFLLQLGAPGQPCPHGTWWQYWQCCHCRCISVPGSASAWALALVVQGLELRGRSRHSHVRTLQENQQARH